MQLTFSFIIDAFQILLSTDFYLVPLCLIAFVFLINLVQEVFHL